MHPWSRNLCLVAVLFGKPGLAAEVDMRDFVRLQRGMTEAEVLYRLGRYDHETVFTDAYHQPIRKRWSYLPAYGRRGWITEITFDSRGLVSGLERYRP